MSKINAIAFLGLIVIVSLLCVQCSRDDHRQPEKAAIKLPKSDVDLQEEGVYSTVLNDVYVREGANRLVIEDDTTLHTLTPEEIRNAMAVLKRGTWNDLDPRVVEDLLGKNSGASKLTGRLNSKVDVLMLSKEELAAIGVSEDFWKEFFARYPDQSIITLSRVGFSDDRRSALVVTGEQCGGRCGKGMYVYLTREGDHWTIKHKIWAWAS